VEFADHADAAGAVSSLAFDRLFKDEASPADKSVLDAVLADAQDLRRGISAAISASSTSISNRSAMWRSASKTRASEASCKAGDPRWTNQTSSALPMGFRRTSQSTCGSCATCWCWAFQTDTTRITTLKLNNDHSALRFPNLPSVQQVGHGIDYMIHHLLSHSDGADWLESTSSSWSSSPISRGSWMPSRKGRAPAGQHDAHALLQHDGRAKHDNDQLPGHRSRWAGGAQGRAQSLDYSGKPERQLCRLFMSMMDKMNVRSKKYESAQTALILFGDAEGFTNAGAALHREAKR
jgi:hypothetical protein